MEEIRINKTDKFQYELDQTELRTKINELNYNVENFKNFKGNLETNILSNISLCVDTRLVDCLGSVLKPLSQEYQNFREFYQMKLAVGGEKFKYEPMPLGLTLD
jgi:hypothetical protein